MIQSAGNKIFLDRTILLTRPLHQCASLAAAIKQQGGSCRCLPMLTIEFAPDQANLQQQILALLQPQTIAIFLSANAVMGVQSLLPLTLMNRLLTCIAIGTATAQALVAAGITRVKIPQQHNSEGILQMPCLQQISKQQVVIFCGENPRSLLAEILQQRQANVHTIFCYRRRPVHYTKAILADALLEVDSVICTSQEGLQQLLTQLSPDLLTMLGRCRLIVISERLAVYAHQFDLHPLIALDASDAAILQALE